MNKKSFVFGLGVGFVILSIIFYTVNIIENRLGKNAMQAYTPTAVPTATPIPTVTPVLSTPIPTQQPETIIKIEKEALSDDEIIQRAIELGMVFVEDVPEETPVETGVVEKTEFITLRIPPGSSAAKIADLLKENEIIDDAESFTRFVAGNLATRQLMAGEFVFRYNSDYTEIMNVLLKNKKY